MRVPVVVMSIALLILGACASVATPLPPPTATATPPPTETVSAQQLTEAVNFRLTLPPSFTPTFTPSASPTPTSTFTPTATATATTIPADLLCESFIISNTFIGDEMRTADIGKVLLFDMPFESVTIVLEIINLETDDIIEEGTLIGGQSWTLDFRANNFPDIGEYQWRTTLTYQGEAGLCERTGEFSTTPADLGTVIPDATAEVTAEVPDEAIAESTIDVTPELTPEVTDAPAVTPEATPQPTATQPFRFPPR